MFLTATQIKSGEYIFGGDEQGDAIRNIEGYIKWNSGNVALISSPLFKIENISTSNSWSTDSSWNRQKTTFDASNVVPTAEENRARNLTFKVWVLVKD